MQGAKKLTDTLIGKKRQNIKKVFNTFIRLLLNAKTCFVEFMNAIEGMNRKKIKAIEFFEFFISCCFNTTNMNRKRLKLLSFLNFLLAFDYKSQSLKRL